MATQNSTISNNPPTASRGYTETEIASMQRDAVRRVNEMQRIAKERLSMQYQNSHSPSHTPTTAPTQNVTASAPVSEVFSPSATPAFFPPAFSPTNSNAPVDNNPPAHNSSGLFSFFGQAGQSGVLTGILDRLNLDSETLILIGMLLLLINEGSDSMLILALVYILL